MGEALKMGDLEILGVFILILTTRIIDRESSGGEETHIPGGDQEDLGGATIKVIVGRTNLISERILIKKERTWKEGRQTQRAVKQLMKLS